MPPPGFLQRRLLLPLFELLRQGLSPEKLALSLVAGVALGIFPVLGSTTVLCALAAWALGLNLPAIQVVNYLVYPLQIALLLPFIRLGEWLFDEARLAMSVSEILALVADDLGIAFTRLWTATWHAVVAWTIVASIAALVGYWPLVVVMRRLAPSDQGRNSWFSAER